jgi:hypothetical protein
VSGDQAYRKRLRNEGWEMVADGGVSLGFFSGQERRGAVVAGAGYKLSRIWPLPHVLNVATQASQVDDLSRLVLSHYGPFLNQTKPYRGWLCIAI